MNRHITLSILQYFFTHPYIDVTLDNESYALSKLKRWLSLDCFKY